MSAEPASGAGFAPRAAAFDLLRKVFVENRALDDATGAHAFMRLPDRDRAFAIRLARSVCRGLTGLDAAIDAHVKRPPPPPARLILRLGAAQLADPGGAPHAIVDAAVALAKAKGATRQAGLINAVLRRVADARGAIAPGVPPVWLTDIAGARFGAAAACGLAAAFADAQPPLDLTAFDDDAPPGAVMLGRRRWRFKKPPALSTLPGFAAGTLQVQDAAAAIPALILNDALAQASTVADFCAAPGGKTAQLAAAGHTVWAIDRAERRLDRLRGNMARLGLADRVRAITADATAWRAPAPLDGGLIDALCTATGTLRRHPDVIWTKRPKDAASLAQAQDALIDAAARAIKPGGLMVYAVCSLLPQEGEDRMAAAYARLPQLTPHPITPIRYGLPPQSAATDGALRILPHHWADRGGLDGFYIAAARVG